MGENSKIEWTQHTFNPWWGCARVSPGCEHCYAETFSKRVGLKVWGIESDRRFFGDKHWNEPLKWDVAAAKAGERHRVFCASMADVFEDRRDLDEQRARLWALIDRTQNLDWLLLTKRPQNAKAMIPSDWLAWPRRNVWFGTTVEDQRRANERIPLLQAIPAFVRFLSCEPLLGRLDLRKYLWDYSPTRAAGYEYMKQRAGLHVDWVIVGGESGPRARECDLDWISDLVQQCYDAGVATFVKQLGSRPVSSYAISVGGAPSPVPIRLADSKGGDWSEWPEWLPHLRERAFPTAAA